jgi:Fe-S-cluster containining protein
MDINYKTPERLKMLTDNCRHETLQVIRKLQKKKAKFVDDLVHRLHYEAFGQFSCLECANCCKTTGPRLTDMDISRLALHMKIKPSDFTERYVVTDEDGDMVFNQHPCPFLAEDNYCLVYENRPRACREYPHTDRKRFIQILDLSHKNCEICPVVFKIFSELKKY